MTNMETLFIGYPPCSTCKKAYKVLQDLGIEATYRNIKEDNPTKEEIQMIIKTFGIKSERELQHIHELEKQAASQKIGEDIGENLSSTPTTITRLYRPSPDGCEECGHAGYKGRMGIYEVLDNSVDIQKLIVGNATSNTIQDQAIKEGMMTMQTDGFIKALRGQTSIEEILRVTRE